ncbi:hypothetical protein H5410_031117 [Solanum commersonii]|uniref:Uncharacterized protein n=1 Tax=Solanum commersonii TaxID=4109 RepID=A0A9J5YG91_SOLCO|nr:hypothetical protein H5410_031117 [Solanum commersonii]
MKDTQRWPVARRPSISTIGLIYFQLLNITKTVRWKCMMFQNDANPKAKLPRGYTFMGGC